MNILNSSSFFYSSLVVSDLGFAVCYKPFSSTAGVYHFMESLLSSSSISPKCGRCNGRTEREIAIPLVMEW